LGAGSTATSKTATITDGGTNSSAVSALGITATTSAGTNVMIGGSDTITNGTNNTVQNATSFIATTSAGTNTMIGASNTITAGANTTTFTSTGYTATVSGTNQIVALSTTPSIVIGTGNNQTSTTNGSININSAGAGYSSTNQIQIQNNNSTAGFTTGVPSVHYYKAGRNAVQFDTIGSTHYYAKNASGTKAEFANFTALAQNTTAGSESAYLGLNVAVAGAMTNFLNCNGATNVIQANKSIDMNGNQLKTSSSGISIDASTSGGLGFISLVIKPGGNLIITGLPTSSAGLPTNAVWRNGTVLNIV
jgi:hypothetical protein